MLFGLIVCFLLFHQVLVKDMKIKLLGGMKDLLDKGMKIQVIRAWGWFVRMLGSHALKTRQLVNDLLKIPECTFTDLDPQVQIATLVLYMSYCIMSSMIHRDGLCVGCKVVQ